MKSPFVFFADVLFMGFISLLLSLVVFNYFLPYPYQLLVSILVSLLCILIYYHLSRQKQNHLKLKKTEKVEYEKLISHLNFSTLEQQVSVVEVAVKKHGLLTEKHQGSLNIKDKFITVFCRFGFDKVSKSDIVRAFNMLSKNHKAFILAETFDQDVIDFAKRFDGRIILVDGKTLYRYLKEHDCMPLPVNAKPEPKNKGDFKNLLDKRKAKNFLLFGTSFLFLSYFAPIKTYYVVCGCIFLIYSLILRFFGKDFHANTNIK